MSDRTFVDTNVLLYAHDLDAGKKHTTAQRTLEDLWSERTGVLSAQVLQELYVNITRKIAKPLSRISARSVVESYAPWCIDISSAQIAAAFRIEDESKISFWDALICASALKSGANRLLSEDLNAGHKIAGIRIVNPFR